MKTILFFIPNLGGGGAERVLVNLVNNLDKTKYKITVQTIFDVGVNKKGLKDHIQYIGGFKKVIPANTKIFKLFSPKSLYKKFIKKRYDVVVSYLEGPTARIVAGCPYKDTKLISWIHVEQHTMKNAAYSFRTVKEARACYNRFDKTICVAESVKEDFTKLFNLKNPCEVLYNTNEDNKIILKASEEVTDLNYSHQTNIVSVGRLIDEKGYDRLISAHKKLLENGLENHVYVFGTGLLKDKLAQQIKEYKVQNTFHLMGFKDNPYKYVSKGDLFVCSSRREGFSTAVTEALIMGVPVVSTLCSGAYELLGANNEYGIINENSEDGVFNGLYEMLSTPGLLDYYRKKAVERGKCFSKNNTIKAVEKMLDGLFA